VVAPVHPIDFGNGFIAAFAHSPVIIHTHEGLYVPEWDTPVREFANVPGGTIGPAREQTRPMSFGFAHDRVHTIDQIRRMFRPGDTYTISSERGSMPYRVVHLGFPESLLRAEQEFSLTIRSPWPYPVREQAVKQMGSTSAMQYPHSWPHAYDSMIAASEIVLRNEGSVTAEPILELIASATGTLAVTHADGSLSVAVTAGDTVSIDSARWAVERNGVTALPEMASTLSWPVLRYGDNVISFSQPVTCIARWDVRESGLI
jgi:hypothetical protein